jgi:hypothetical protein
MEAGNGRATLPRTYFESSRIGKFQANVMALAQLLPDDVYDVFL